MAEKTYSDSALSRMVCLKTKASTSNLGVVAVVADWAWAREEFSMPIPSGKNTAFTRDCQCSLQA